MGRASPQLRDQLSLQDDQPSDQAVVALLLGFVQVAEASTAGQAGDRRSESVISESMSCGWQSTAKATGRKSKAIGACSSWAFARSKIACASGVIWVVMAVFQGG
jgi:hypothetical protein